MEALLALAMLMQGFNAADTYCGSQPELAEALAWEFGESAIALSMEAGKAYQFYSNLDTGSWTLTLVGPLELTCVVAFGENLRLTKRQFPARNDVIA